MHVGYFTSYDYWIYPTNDTLVNGFNYKKYPTGSFQYVLLREDTIQKKVWRLSSNQSSETLLYDFTLGVGGQLKIYSGNNVIDTLVVTQIDSALTNAGYRKRFIFYDIQGKFNVCIIESVGSLELPTGIHYYPSDPSYSLNCSYQNNQAIYFNPLATCSLYTNTDEINSAISVSISPNPFSSVTTLHTDNIFKNAILVVFNSYGQAVKEIKNISGQAITLHRDNLPDGLYFIRLAEGKKIYTGKLIIKGN